MSEKDIHSLKTFIQTIVYSGKDDEDYLATRIRLFQNLKTKSSMAIPPDPDSVVQVIKRAHHQVYQWLRCCIPLIEKLPLDENGWNVVEDKSEITIKPVWFTGSQLLPPSAQKSKKPKKVLPASPGDIADDDLTENEDSMEPPKRKKQKRLSKKEREEIAHSTSDRYQETDRDADTEFEVTDKE